MFSSETVSLIELLDEIPNESGLELFNSVLHEVSPPGFTGMTGLDALLLPDADSSSSASPLNRGDVIEIQGGPASGKTQLTYYLTMTSVLPGELLVPFSANDSESLAPKPLQKIDLGGWDSAAVVFDLDGSWDVRKLQKMLERRLLKRLSGGRDDAQLTSSFSKYISDCVSGCLQRVHLFRPTSMLSLAYTLLNLPRYHRQRMSSQEISLVIIDSLSAFHWQDRYSREQPLSSSKDKDSGSSNALDWVLMALQDIRLKYGPVIVLTNWGLLPVQKSSSAMADTMSTTQQTQDQTHYSSPFYHQHLNPFPAPFELPVRHLPNAAHYIPITHHITLHAPSLSQISSELTVDDALGVNEQPRHDCGVGETRGILRLVNIGQVGTFSIYIGPNEISGEPPEDVQVPE